MREKTKSKKIRKVWKIKPRTRIQVSSKKEKLERMRNREKREWI